MAYSGAITEQGTLTTLSNWMKESGEPATPDVRMLPAYDNYLIGYRTRENSVPALHQSRVWPGGGLIRPTVIADGLAIGTWTRRSGGRSVQVDAFEHLLPHIQREVDSEAADVVGFVRNVVGLGGAGAAS